MLLIGNCKLLLTLVILSVDFSHDGSMSSTLHSSHSFESEMRATRLSLLDEIGKRKMAEDALSLMYNQWQRVADLLSTEAGLRFPAPSTGMQLEIGPIEQFCQEVVVTRYVSKAIGQGLARAEAETAADEILKAKDQEISRLRDRLQYYEAVNHEMSQRNQEAIGMYWYLYLVSSNDIYTVWLVLFSSKCGNMLIEDKCIFVLQKSY